MNKLLATLFLSLTAFSAQAADTGMLSRTSPYPVVETLDRLEAVLKAKGVTIFARIDHAAAAQGAGLTLRPAQLLIFGNPRAGTPLMQAAPSIGLDLPMKTLAWQDAQGQTHVTWNTPDYLIQRHGLEAAYVKNLAAISGLIEAAINK